ncbi:hypothetical protein [Clostridioides difficile]|uniref:hypothetical protein n=1 Tax=Clostridioides difficile TaxID=1496 RepID=UPI00093E5004|nr:hypothetical protein [Clostridioides difficile]MBJ9763374.1 hypothetical protein [Clostridioides difficile]MCJ0310290.1 hypothetical protein [Clostridioides difficile]MCJ0377564.1 hypothetical protein [Clostridioides difficile]MCJ0412172.1 hypothetical protein [Clostridioides difficile]MCL6801952.1 hypothetical protein [Clostridioides difficile]
MVIKVNFGGNYSPDYIYVPNEISLKKYEIRNEFHNWIDNTEDEHPFWCYENGVQIGLDYRGDAIVYWLNNYILKNTNDKARLIESFSNKKLDYDLIINL